MRKRAIAAGVAHDVPADLADALFADGSVLALWEDLTPLARNEWICWVEDAKRDQTRRKRIGRVGADLKAGKRRPCCWPGCPHREMGAGSLPGPANMGIDELWQAVRPLISLINKSEKARQKLAPETWQHAMLEANLRALRMASALMDGKTGDERHAEQDDVQGALRALASMIRKTENAGTRFSPGTSQHTLLQNRLKALRVAETFIQAKRLQRCFPEPSPGV